MSSIFKCLLGPLSRPSSRKSSSSPEPSPSPRPEAPMIPGPFLVVPLYLYPSPGSWDRLTHTIQANPTVHFVLVINPNSGPGSSPLPDANYIAAIGGLIQFPNVHLIGYVHVSYSKRNPAEVRADIDVYRGWNDSVEPRLRVDGIFFDEASSDASTADSLGSLAAYVRQEWARGLNKHGLVVYNPGVPVDNCFFRDADYVIVVEESDKKLLEFTEAIQEAKPDQQGQTVACIHSFKGRDQELDHLLKRLMALGFGGIYVTDQDGGGYSQWPVAWEEQVTWAARRRGA